ncbi:MAG: RNA-directed DNA polymerase, partial [Paraglaciecola sp.]
MRTVNQHFNQLKIEQAPDKTFIGKISRGWEFLGY